MVLSKVTVANDWECSFDSVYALGSPITLDVNDDAIKDIIISIGNQDTSNRFVSGVVAINGDNGSLIWRNRRKQDVFGIGKLLDVNNDNFPEIISVGRSGELFALNAKNGFLIWEFFDTGSLNSEDSGIYNFYDPQIINDVNNDNIKDILITNGGNPNAESNDTLNRYQGYLLIVNGATGKVLAKLNSPDRRETYMAPIIHDFKNASDPVIIFGTGGETINGSLWSIKLSDLLSEDSTKFIKLISDSTKGFITTPSLVDINNDGILDIIAVSFNSNIYAIDGANFEIIWTKSFPNYESYTFPAVGLLNSDTTPDIALSIGLGVFSSYTSTLHLVLDGVNGNVLDSFSVNADFSLSSPIVFNIDADLYDEVLFFSSTAFSGIEKCNMHYVNPTKNTNQIYDSIVDRFLFASTPLIASLNDDNYMDLIFASTQNFMDHNTKLLNTIIHKKKIANCQLYEPAWGSIYGKNYDAKYDKNNNIPLAINNTSIAPVILNFNVSYENGFVHLNQLFDENENATVQLLNQVGQLVLETKLKRQIYIGSLTNAIYTILVHTKDKLYVSRFVKL